MATESKIIVSADETILDFSLFFRIKVIGPGQIFYEV